MAEEKIVLKIPATISKITTMADKGIRIQVDTQELHPEDAGRVMLLNNKLGWFVFAEQLSQVDIENLPKIEVDEESGEEQPATRLRKVLFVFWKQHKIQEPFDAYYKRAIEKFISSVKEKLN